MAMLWTKCIGFVFLLFAQFCPIFAQRDANWFVGHYPSSWIRFDTSNSNTGLTFVNGVSRGGFNESGGTMSDKQGNLLFYMNGIGGTLTVYNKLHLPMPGGMGIDCAGSTTQGVLILPDESDSLSYYIFYISGTPNSGPTLVLKYFIIDMHLDGGLGEVVFPQNPILYDNSYITEKLSAVKHANGKDWWILFHEIESQEFIKLLFDGNSFQGPYFQAIGSVHSEVDDGELGEMTFSEQGDRLVAASFAGLLNVFDFDRCTGELSNLINLDHAQDLFYGCAFSPEGRFLYVTHSDYRSNAAGTCSKVYQYDLQANDISGSRVIISPIRPTNECPIWGQLELGIDGKLYVGGGGKYFHVINKPDLSGLACSFRDSVYKLDTLHDGWMSYHLPNYPNYELGPLPIQTIRLEEDTTICVGDTITIGMGNVSGSTVLYTWSPASGLSDPTVASPMAFPEETTTYSLLAVDTTLSDNCIVGNWDNKITITVEERIVHGKPTDTVRYCPGELFSLGTLQEPGFEYAWQPDIWLSTPWKAQTVAEPKGDLLYIREVIDLSKYSSCKIRRDSIYVIEGECFLPNVLSPNADGVNDKLVFEGFYGTLELYVYDRWGKEVFSSKNYSNDWQGDRLPAGVYYYVLISSFDSEAHTSTLTLLR